MGVINTAKRTAQFTLAAMVLGSVGFYFLTRPDTSNDRTATVITKLTNFRGTTRGGMYVHINSAERSAESISDSRPEITETFWLRPGEKVSLYAHLYFGKGVLSCQILIDGNPVGPPVVSIEDYEAQCMASAVG